MSGSTQRTKRTKRAPKKGGDKRDQAKRSAPDWAPAFLSALSETANITVACGASGICRNTFYARRDSDQAFAQLVANALDQSCDLLEFEARRRAKDGVERKKFTPDKIEYVEREYSDTLLIFLLKAHRPEKYRDRYEVKHQGSVKLELVEEIIDGGTDGSDINHSKDDPPA